MRRHHPVFRGVPGDQIQVPKFVGQVLSNLDIYLPSPSILVSQGFTLLINGFGASQILCCICHHNCNLHAICRDSFNRSLLVAGSHHGPGARGQALRSCFKFYSCHLVDTC